MAKVVGIVQARLGATRLRNKVLMDIAGHSLLWHVVNRVSKAKTLDHVLLAVPDTPEERYLRACCMAERWDYYAGPLDDVLARFYGAACYARADVVVRITGDCPMIDPATIDAVVDLLRREQVEYASNIIPFDNSQDGSDVEAMTFDLLQRAHLAAQAQSDREHVTLWMRRNSDRQALYTGGPRNLWSVDTQEDLDRVRKALEAERQS